MANRMNDEEAARSPEPGDYWHDHLMPVLCVLEVTEEYVIYCDRFIYSAENLIMAFDLTKVKKVSRKDFINFFSYKFSIKVWGSIIRSDRYKEAWLKQYQLLKNKNLIEIINE